MAPKAWGLGGPRLPLNCTERPIDCCGYNAAAFAGSALQLLAPGEELRPGEAGR
jgi:hypothetical protein